MKEKKKEKTKQTPPPITVKINNLCFAYFCQKLQTCAAVVESAGFPGAGTSNSPVHAV